MRFVPKAIDYAIFLIQLVILGSYFYVAYIWTPFGETNCKADIGSNVPLAKNASNSGVDVSHLFKIAIRWGFWMSLLTFIRAILAQVGLYLKRWVLLWVSYVMFAANISISIVLFILMQVWRWSHAGKVCSGDYLPDRDEGDRDVYLIFEGKFIKSMLLAVYSIMSLSCISISIVSICVYKRHAEEDAANGDNDLDTSASNNKRQSAFTKALDPDYEAAMRESSRSEMKKKFFADGETNKKSPTALEERQKLLSVPSK